MLYEILCALGILRNESGKLVHSVYRGRVEISNGTINTDLKARQWYMISGSVFNDGVYCHPATLIDETFDGSVIRLSLPKAFLDLVAEIEAYEQKHGNSPYTSESFGGYTYSKALSSNGSPIGWRQKFADRLSPWRMI